MLRSRAIYLATLIALVASSRASAIKIPLGLSDEELTLNVGALLQPWFQISNPTLPNPNTANLGGVDAQFFLRRARIVLSGSITKRITFFIDTDVPRFGQGGKFDQQFYIQDAVLSGEYVKNHYIDGGIILIPFAHFAIQGAAGLFALDYPTIVSKPPNGVGKAWRDTGVQLRGYFLDRRLMYRVGVFTGVGRGTQPTLPATGGIPATPTWALNPDGIPRFAGTFRFNIFGRENDFFLKGIYFAEKPMLSLGVAADYQRRSTASADHATDSFAFAADLFSETPVAKDTEVILQATYVLHRQGTLVPNNRGQGGVLEGGVRWRWLSVLLQAEYFHSTVDNHDQVALHGGLNWWVRKHNANFKFDFAWKREGDLGNAPDGYVGTLQGQIFL